MAVNLVGGGHDHSALHVTIDPTVSSLPSLTLKGEKLCQLTASVNKQFQT